MFFVLPVNGMAVRSLIPFVRLLLAALFTGLALTGCAHANGGKPKDAASSAQNAKSPAKTAPAKRPVVVPINSLAGKVALVNTALRYVVIDFSLSRTPAAGQRLNVYREGQKVGEVIVSDQSRDHNFAADIAAGNVQAGDEVRED
ncbi:MAG: hypothetical protein ACRD82_03880 [Blastocatellia bacterium]